MLGTEKPLVEDNVTFILKEYFDPDTNVKELNLQIIDDKNVPGNTLASRRIYLLNQGVKVKKLTKAVFFLGDLIKISNLRTWFIDSNGKLFQYKKDTSVPLIFKKIKRFINIPSGGSILEIEDIPGRFKTLHNIAETDRYAGLLKYGQSHILYGVYRDKHKDTRRML